MYWQIINANNSNSNQKNPDYLRRHNMYQIRAINRTQTYSSVVTSDQWGVYWNTLFFRSWATFSKIWRVCSLNGHYYHVCLDYIYWQMIKLPFCKKFQKDVKNFKQEQWWVKNIIKHWWCFKKKINLRFHLLGNNTQI